MNQEASFITRVASASAEELAQILTRPTAEQERVMRDYFGEERYRRLHAMALRRNLTRSRGAEVQGNVVVIHGIMGSDLTEFVADGGGGRIWASVLRLARGHFERLRLDEDGRGARHDVRATGIMNKYYGELILALSRRWRVRPFWFDWRKDLNIAASDLAARISSWFGDSEPVHIVAHSMGGLVARTFILNHEARWKTMWDKEGKGRRGGRLVMLGTPNHGSFAVPQILTALEPMIKKLALLDLTHNRTDLAQIAATFCGAYQMLPSPLVNAKFARLYEPESYGSFAVSEQFLKSAREHHEKLADIVDPERMIYVAGYDQPTISGFADKADLTEADAYEVTLDGDGRVPHALGLLKTKGGEDVPTFYVREDHGLLPENEQILASLDELLETGRTENLAARPEAARALVAGEAAGEDAKARLQSEVSKEEQEIRRLGQRLAVERGLTLESFDGADAEAARAAINRAAPAEGEVSREEQQLAELLMRGNLGGEQARPQPTAARTGVPQIRIRVVYGRIEEVGDRPVSLLDGTRHRGDPPVDAISVGHYIGVKPTAAEGKLDEAISRSLRDAVNGRGANGGGKIEESERLLYQYTMRGTIGGGLGQPFLLNDPRAKNGRVIALAGMGEPGRFGAPELTVLARELCWALGRLNKRHLATVLIGSGVGGVAPKEAITSWLRGVAFALSNSTAAAGHRLEQITFVEFNPSRIDDLDAAIIEAKREMAGRRLEIKYDPLTPAENAALDRAVDQWNKEAWERRQESRRKNKERREEDALRQDPARLTVSLERSTYSFAAITRDASIPEREIPLDPLLVEQVNNEIAAAADLRRQVERGQLLEHLLLPEDLRKHLHAGVPIVLMLDSTTARIHWEMVAQSWLTAELRATQNITSFEDARDFFLSTGRSLTRQLRTKFAPLPEPPPPPTRTLRVLVVADPAEDARLPGAEEEGVEVADLFERFNKLYPESGNVVEVTRLFGPREATRPNVLGHLMLRSYDILHFAGHCVYDKEDPPASGWIFSAKSNERLTARELNRVDRVPKFIFSNACESGITPERAEERSANLAPSFAEAFFARGVANFVCTAWPVNDFAARVFAKTLYASLLGLKEPSGLPAGSEVRPDQYERALSFEPMHIAMLNARLKIAPTLAGLRTWGAYQHYGNPYLQFFTVPQTLRAEAGADGLSRRNNGSTPAKKAGRKQRSKKAAAKSRERP
jgi:pimeloyl-ACP methyl ester carboxylesterase